MNAPLRPRRSVLFMPGSNARALEKARELPADGLIFDLEDAVAPDRKELARRQVGEAVAAGGYGSHELILRINPLTGEWGADDLAAAAAMPIHAVLLPKVENAAGVKRAVEVLNALAAPPELQLWCMVETPRGVLAAADIAGADPRVAALVMGTSDLTKDLHARELRDRLPLMTALGLVLLAARAYRCAVLDGVHLALEDAAGFELACRQGRDLGFDGKTLIHPSQIATANTAFSPAEAEITRSRRIVAAYREAVAAGQGAARIDGRLVEALHLEEAERILALANAIGADSA